MNAHARAITAYGNPTTAQKSPRSAEYDVISRITARLQQACLDEGTSFGRLAEALHDNRRLWVELATDLALPGNALPSALRAQLLGLAQFSLRHTAEVLAGRAAPEVLIDINLAILRGLSGRGTAE